MFCAMFYSKLLLHNDLGGCNAESLRIGGNFIEFFRKVC